MNLLAISDLHLSPSSVSRTQTFLKFLDTANKNRDEILFVADLFDLLFGERNLTFPYQFPILSEMKKMAEAGLIMYYVEGNRDFGIANYRGELFRDVSDTSFSMKWGERRIFAEH